uniref:Cyclin-like domain-containing protein n=1 Tax=Timema shepardi TaxID=629360 RepID=A0A7R9ANJ7_TIMSH|nr:unnamed protein product [Timema shepardi]
MVHVYRADVKRESLTASQPGVICKVDFRVLCETFRQCTLGVSPFASVAMWVCEEQRCEDQVFPLAVNFLDRFLCRCSISRRQLQLTAAVSLLLASKIRQCHALSVDLLCFYTDHSITPDEMRDSGWLNTRRKRMTQDVRKTSPPPREVRDND